jgi:iron complex outermembrane receptor protein
MGVDYRHLAATDQESFYSAPTALTQLQNFNSSTFGKADQAFTGVFAQTTLAPTAALELTLSARYDNWSNTERFNTRSTTSATTGGAQPDSTASGLNPSIAGRYVVNDDLALRAATYKSFRAPGFNNTTRTYGSPPTIANPDIGPENLTGRELGMDYSKGALSFGATYFQYDITNMIATYKISNYATAPALVQTICGASLVNCAGSASFYTNDQDGESHGLELTAQWELASNLKLNAAYTRTVSTLTRVGASVTSPIGVQLTATPEHMANLGISWQPLSKLRTNLQARYIGPLIIETSAAGISYEQGGMTIFDASAQYALSKDTDLTFSVVNLFDKEYSENAYAYNQPWSRTLSSPRTVNVGVKFRF